MQWGVILVKNSVCILFYKITIKVPTGQFGLPLSFLSLLSCWADSIFFEVAIENIRLQATFADVAYH